MKYLGFCGADDKTNIDDMIALSQQCPRIEWGILFHPDKQSIPRYPSQSFVDTLCQKFSQLPSYNLAAHLCGDHVETLLKGDAAFVIKLFLAGFNRIQINATVENGVDLERLLLDKECSMERLHDVIKATPYLDWIFQSNNQTSALVEEFSGSHPNVFVLHDASCGTGTTIEDFPMIQNCILQGYAGGIGVHNVVTIVKKLNNTMRDGQYWIDMESKLRNDSDMFQIKTCQQIVKLVLRNF